MKQQAATRTEKNPSLVAASFLTRHSILVLILFEFPLIRLFVFLGVE